MHIFTALRLLSLACSITASNLRPRDYELYDYYALHLDARSSPSDIAAALGLEYESRLGELQDHHIFSAIRHQGDVVDAALQELQRRRLKRAAGTIPDLLDGVLLSQKQEARRRLYKRVLSPIPEMQAGPPATDAVQPPAVPTTPVTVSPPVDVNIVKQQEIARSLGIQDPIFKDQWHLFNPVELGHDVNVTDVWMQGITGQNATVAIVDDGLDMYSDDLKNNYFAEGSWDYNDPGPEPKPRLSDDRHGTRCAGEIGAVKNNVCGVGVAWDTKVAGIRILSAPISDADEAVALNYQFQKNLIYSCSWGPPDDGQSMDAPGILIKRAMVNAVQNGRDGKGSIYVFASGNGAANEDNCNFDGYTNSIYSITVGAIDRKGMHPYYSEKCSAQLVVTYSSGSGDAIHTTDVGTNACFTQHGGTSAAAPLAAGIFSLVLCIRPDLSWRDLQYLVLDTAVPVNEDDGDWQNTTMGKRFSHKYGYGKLDAYAIVEAAKDFVSVKPQAWYNSPWMHVKQKIPQGDQGLASTFEVTTSELQDANLEALEHVTVTMNVEHARRGDLSVELKSPNNVVSHLSATRRNDASTEGYADWTFMSVVHWGESGLGTWTVVVKDTQVNEHNGTFVDWKLTLWGQSIDASRQELLPMPTEHDDDNHDAPTTASAITTSVLVDSSSTTEMPPSPTDHIDRPINAKPSDTDAEVTSAAATSDVPSVTSITASSMLSPTSTATAKPDHFLPSFFPTFGVSKRTQIWIYGALGLIVVFCVGLGTYFYTARGKRLRNSRDDIEFEMLDDHDDFDDGAANGAAGGRKGKRRAGELYDAFAGESDEDLFSDEDEKAYRDGHGGEPEEEQRGRRPSRDDSEKLLGR
ncbi:MAG: pheromone processing endoprotease [Pycnora praestabilis]|nr:MAG: pheromone processing endoprotease [Pycnora praestabilis]